MAFQGSLAELHLPDIIQLVSVSGKSGVFQLTDGANRGQIYLQEGRIVHAELDDMTGEEAVYALAIWRQGEFRFEAGVAAARQTITKSNTNLLMEAARRLDEWRVLSKKIPSLDLVPEFVILENRDGQINLNTMEWLLLSKIDAHRSVRGIATAAGLSVFDAAKLLYGLVATGLIRLKASPAPRPVAARPATAAPPSKPSTPAPAPALAAPTVAAAPAPTAPPRAAPPPSPAQATPAPASSPAFAHLQKLRDEAIALLGPPGQTVVQKHYQRARAEVERGAGLEAVEEAAQQIARAAGVLKGQAAAEAILDLAKRLR